MVKTDTSRAIIIDAKNRVLLGKRRRGQFAGSWGLIGGKLEKGEYPEACIIREVFEELSVVLKNFKLWKDFPIAKPTSGKFWHIYFYVGQIEGKPKFKKDEISEIGYFGPEDLAKFNFAFNHQEILAEFFGANKILT